MFFIQIAKKCFSRELAVFGSVEELNLYLQKSRKTIFTILTVFAVIVTILSQILVHLVYGWNGLAQMFVIAFVQFFVMMFCAGVEANICAPEIEDTEAMFLKRVNKGKYQVFLILPKSNLPAIAILELQNSDLKEFRKFFDVPDEDFDVVYTSSAPKESIQFTMETAWFERNEKLRLMQRRLERWFICLMFLFVTVGMLNIYLSFAIIFAFLVVFVGLYRLIRYHKLDENWVIDGACELTEISSRKAFLTGFFNS